MRVLLNAISAKMGGAANYIRNIACELERVAPEDEFIIVLPANQARAIKRTAPNIRIITRPNAGLLKRNCSTRRSCADDFRSGTIHLPLADPIRTCLRYEDVLPSPLRPDGLDRTLTQSTAA